MKAKVKKPIKIKGRYDPFIPFNVIEEEDDYQIIETDEKNMNKLKDIMELDIIVENKRVVTPGKMECIHCGKTFMIFEAIGINRIPIVEDQPCPYCFISKSGKKFDENGKEIK